jgi:hypothetical protein
VKIRVQLSDVRAARFWCTKHDCELVPNESSWTNPIRTRDEIIARQGEDAEPFTEDQIDAILTILARFGHTRCSQSPASRIWPEFMLGEPYFTCPAAEAEYAVDHLGEEDADPDVFGRFMEEDWPHWIMEVGRWT